MLKQFMALTALGITTSFSLVCVASEARNIEHQSKLERVLTPTMAQWQKDWATPGVAIGVIKNGQVILAKGFGFSDVKKRIPVEPSTVFSIGSVTKTFTATLAGIAVSQGHFDWDTPVIHYDPSFRLSDKKTQNKATLRDLFSHQTGLPFGGDLYEKQKLNEKEVYQRVAEVKLNFPLRQGWEYTSLDYLLGGNIIAKNDWQKNIQERILQPLKMTSTFTSVASGVKDPRVSLPYDVSGEVLDYSYDMENIAPGGAMFSNLSDMLKFADWWLSPGSKVKINQATKISMLEPSVEWTDKSAYDFYQATGIGLGWFNEKYRNLKLNYHTGVTSGFSAQLTIVPEKQIAVVVLSNRFGNPIPFIATHFVIDQLLDITPHDWNGYFLSLPKNEE